MTSVAMSLMLEGEENPSLEVSGGFAAEEIVLLQQFVGLVLRVRECSLLRRGMPSLSALKFEAGSGLSITCADYTDAELFELLHVLRPVSLEEERASFHRVAALLGRNISSAEVRAYLKLQKRVFRHGEMNLYCQVSINSQPLFDESLLRIWLNGTQYHTDAEKAEAWAQLESALQEGSARALVMAQLHSRVVTLFNVDYVARQVIAGASVC